MSVSDPRGRANPPPGWYPDSTSPTRQQRYWDGQSWTEQVWAPSITSVDVASPPPKKPRRKIAWLGVAVFCFGAIVVTSAVLHGQPVKSVHLTSGVIELYPLAASKTLTPDEIQGSQPVIKDRVRKLEAKAQAVPSTSTAPSEPTAPSQPRASSVDLSGSWTDEAGVRYDIAQYGSEVVIQEMSPFGVTAVGSGSFQGGIFTFGFEAVDGSVGWASLALVDPQTLKGSFTNDSNGSSALVLRHAK